MSQSGWNAKSFLACGGLLAISPDRELDACPRGIHHNCRTEAAPYVTPSVAKMTAVESEENASSVCPSAANSVACKSTNCIISSRSAEFDHRGAEADAQVHHKAHLRLQKYLSQKPHTPEEKEGPHGREVVDVRLGKMSALVPLLE